MTDFKLSYLEIWLMYRRIVGNLA